MNLKYFVHICNIVGFSVSNVVDIQPSVMSPPGPENTAEKWNSSFHDYFDHFD